MVEPPPLPTLFSEQNAIQDTIDANEELTWSRLIRHRVKEKELRQPTTLDEYERQFLALGILPVNLASWKRITQMIPDRFMPYLLSTNTPASIIEKNMSTNLNGVSTSPDNIISASIAYNKRGKVQNWEKMIQDLSLTITSKFPITANASRYMHGSKTPLLYFQNGVKVAQGRQNGEFNIFPSFYTTDSLEFALSVILFNTLDTTVTVQGTLVIVDVRNKDLEQAITYDFGRLPPDTQADERSRTVFNNMGGISYRPASYDNQPMMLGNICRDDGPSRICKFPEAVRHYQTNQCVAQHPTVKFTDTPKQLAFFEQNALDLQTVRITSITVNTSQ